MQPENNKFTSKEREIVFSPAGGAKVKNMGGSRIITTYRSHIKRDMRPCCWDKHTMLWHAVWQYVWPNHCMTPWGAKRPASPHTSLPEKDRARMCNRGETDRWHSRELVKETHNVTEKSPKTAWRQKKERQKREQSNERVKKSNQS